MVTVTTNVPALLLAVIWLPLTEYVPEAPKEGEIDVIPSVLIILFYSVKDPVPVVQF